MPDAVVGRIWDSLVVKIQSLPCRILLSELEFQDSINSMVSYYDTETKAKNNTQTVEHFLWSDNE